MTKRIDPIAEPIANVLDSGPDTRDKVPVEFELDDMSIKRIEMMRRHREMVLKRPVTKDEVVNDVLKKQLARQSTTEDLFKKGND